jgi:hypothetical protein
MQPVCGRTFKARPRALCAVLCAASVLASACAARRVALPTDAGSPLPDFQQIHAGVSAACVGVRTLTAELSLSGRAGDRRLRGRAIAGFERPASMRLEGVAPFGPPAFILATNGDLAVLLLPRDERVLRGERAEDVLGALTGVALAPADLQAVLTGCVVPAPQAAGGRRHANGWASIDLAGGATLYLEMRNGGWQLRAARRNSWEIEYTGWQGSFPAGVRLVSGDASVRVDLTAALSQFEANVDIDPAAFAVAVPAGVTPISLEELRDAGPLRGAQ